MLGCRPLALALTLTLAAGLDADHISAIDNATRQLVSQGQLPITCGKSTPGLSPRLCPTCSSSVSHRSLVLAGSLDYRHRGEHCHCYQVRSYILSITWFNLNVRSLLSVWISTTN
jgi:hypothetical protein